MITIYKDKRQIPSNMEIVELNDIFFNQNTTEFIDSRAVEIVQQIDGARLVGKYKIISRFHGVSVDIDKLSSGCKTVLNVLYFPDKVFSMKECGSNALDILYSLDKGNIYCEYPMISFTMEAVQVADGENKKIIDDYEKLKEWWDNNV